ncbi:MAG TPA: ChbG/HpnK family deacetylase [Anaeromyxobacteraceae bacterium]|nr:ChbG/HpnK family deacetylase [Anaeromyxobacteraceae bacterium]
MRCLVVNADDLGYDPEIDRGILEAHARGIVTSATAMVLTPFSAAALRAAPPSLGIGLHVVLEPAMAGAAVERAVREQVARFRELRGAAPTHLDSHKHLHVAPGALASFARVAAELGLPVRAIDPVVRDALRRAGVLALDRFLGDAALRPAWTEARLADAVATLGEGTAELMAHPGHRPSHARTSFGVEREIELAALCSPTVRHAVEARGVRLCDYASVRAYR